MSPAYAGLKTWHQADCVDQALVWGLAWGVRSRVVRHLAGYRVSWHAYPLASRYRVCNPSLSIVRTSRGVLIPDNPLT